MKRLLMICLSIGCLAACGGATTYNVFPVPDGNQSIQETILQASAGDVIIVAPGTYYEGNINLSGKAITVQSTNPTDPAVVAATIIDCGGLFSGFYFENGETAATVVDGFTITNAGGFTGGASVCMFGSSPTIRNCVMRNNVAYWDGAGLFCDLESSPVFENCDFIHNSSEISGGAISIWGGNPLFTNCLFVENSALAWGGAIYAYGGSPVFRYCVIAGNYANAGAAFWFDSTIHPQILGCIVIDNTAGSSVSGVYANRSLDLTIENSIFWGNTAIVNSTNHKTIDIAGQMAGTTARIAYCDIQDLATAVDYDPLYTTVEGLIDADPLFVQNGSFTETGDYIPGDWHLQKASPCINTGNPAYVAVSGETDIDGEARVMNGRIEIGVDEVEMAIAAKIDITPEKLNIPGKGFVMAMIRLPQGYAVQDIDAASIRLNGKLSARSLKQCRNNTVAVFELEKVGDLLGGVEGNVELTVTGQLTDETVFTGSDTVQVIQVQWKNWLKQLYLSARKK